jgi:hypothetical protein
MIDDSRYNDIRDRTYLVRSRKEKRRNEGIKRYNDKRDRTYLVR